MREYNPAIIVMAKVPQPGHVKTRLRPVLSYEQSAELSKCFLLDIVAKARQMSVTVIVAFTPADCSDQIKALLPESHIHIEQRGSDLGERIGSAISDAHNQGFAPVVVIGTDSPTLPASYLGLALEHVSGYENGIVIGPSEDGGYYLIGVSSGQGGLFAGVSWSTDLVFEQTIANAKNIPGVSLSQLPYWYDIDEPDDLMRLSEEMESDERARLRAPETFRWLAANSLTLSTYRKASALRADPHQPAGERQG